MKHIDILTDNWYLKEAAGPVYPGETDLRPYWESELGADKGWLPCRMPSVVQEVLLAHGKLDPRVLETGRGYESTWVSERDWVFRTEFAAPAEADAVYLDFLGLDTVVDICMNGKKLCRHESMFMPCRIEIREFLEAENTLLLYFHAPSKITESYELPERYAGKIHPRAILRKAHGDFSPHGGAVPYFTPIGVYDDIRLISVDHCEISYADIETALDRHNRDGELHVKVQRTTGDDITARLRLYHPEGRLAAEEVNTEWISGDSKDAECQFRIPVRQPVLWWPRNYGGQPLYRLEIELVKDGRVLDRIKRTVGFRTVEVIGDMRFRVNGREIKLWGSCITPMWGCSHRWIPERGYQLLEYAARGHMNALRLWGPGQPYHEDFYERACELGILIWQEFHTSGAYMPDIPEFTDLVLQEAKAQIRRLKHYPCIFMWCGGNEQIYMADIFHPEERHRIGHDLIIYHLKHLVAEMDPTRYYHISSPSGGRYANEAAFADSHGSRAARHFVPGERHGHFFSENIRTFIPELKSLRRFIPPEELWPDDYTNAMPIGTAVPIPKSWAERTINNFEKKTGPYELFYDATDPATLVYRLNAAAAHDIREIITKQRHGKPFYDGAGDRRCNGHLFWKLNTAWPQIYCAFLDYYLEPGLPYYMLRRHYAPVHISFDVQDHVYVWGVNDTPDDFDGIVTVEVHSLDTEKTVHRLTFPAGIPSGDSLIVKSLDCLGHIPLMSVLHCTLQDRDGRVVSEDFQYLISERRLPFPDAKLTLRQEGGKLKVSADRFARCVELAGDADGDAFGWQFEDNYFDLMPGQERTIRIYGKHRKGVVTAKAHYSPHAASAQWDAAKG